MGILSSAEMQVYSATAADWATGHSFRVGLLSSAEMQSVYSATSTNWATYILSNTERLILVKVVFTIAIMGYDITIV